jgi:tetratricopeptide (TPR) repeat protein
LGPENVSDHPTREELKVLLRGDLPEERTVAVLRHLLGGCRRCRAVVYPRAAQILSPEPPEPSGKEDAAYDRAIDRAIATARRFTREKALYDEALDLLQRRGPDGWLSAPPRLQGLAGYRALLDRSWALRHENPRHMVALARLATRVADGLDPRRLGERQVEDYRCRAWTELANAQRVANEYDRAVESLSEAIRHLARGTGSEELETRLLEVQATLDGHRCRYAEALDTLEVVAGIYRKRGDRHLAGRALVKQGMFKGYQGKSAEACELTRQGRGMLDEDRDPALYFHAIHNEVHLLIDLERYREARSLLWPNLRRYDEHGGTIDRLKLRGLWGLINAGLGKLDEAARDFEEERKGLLDAGLSYTAAVTGLDLAAVYLEQGRTAEAELVALEAALVFTQMDIPEQGHLAVLLLEKALDLRMATADLLRRTAKFLRRIEHDPEAVFDPTK